MHEFLNSLKISEGGRRFLLNLYWGIRDGLDPALASQLILNAMSARAIGEYDDFFPHCGQFRTTIYSEPNAYQFRGKTADSACGRWMTVKTADDLRVLVLQGLENDHDAFSEIFPDIDPGAALSTGTDDQFDSMASAINDENNNLSFSLGIERDAPPSCRLGPGAKRQGPSWFSRWCTFEQSFAELSPAEAAGRLRDWLGLPVGEEPLFAIRTRGCIEARQILGHRPTVFDGFEGPFYKHPTGSKFLWTGCGSAVDLTLLTDMPNDRETGLEIDGGPELVSKGVRFTPTLFECVFLGRATKLGYSPYGNFHRYLLPPGGNLDNVVLYLVEQITREDVGDEAPTAKLTEGTKCLQRNRCSACVASES